MKFYTMVIKARLAAAVLICTAIFSGNASAAIMINVTDVGGFARFTMSGSDTVTGAGNFNNGFWMHDLAELGAVSGAPNFLGLHSFTGSASFSINSIAYSVDNVWSNNPASFDYEIAFRNTTAPIHPFNLTVGDTLSFTGDIVTDLNYSWFNPGLYSVPHIGPYDASQVTLGSPVQFNVSSSVAPVPEPSTLSIFTGLGLVGLGLRRRRRKS